MNKVLTYGSWLLPLILFLVHQLLQYGLNIPIAWADNYLDPFCAGALGLHLIALERKLYFGQKLLTWTDILVTGGVIIIASEVVLPYLFDRFIADGWDGVAIAGGIAWYLITTPRSITTDE